MFNLQKQKNTSGFTLIELMIVVAIVAIIVAVAVPSYSSYVIRAKRAEGRAALLDSAAILERFYSDNNVYATATNTLPSTVSLTSETGYYNITITVATPFQAYTLTAAPTFTDAECGSLTFQQDSSKGSGGDSTCWSK